MMKPQKLTLCLGVLCALSFTAHAAQPDPVMLNNLDALRVRAGAEGVMAAKAQAWLDFAQEEFIEIDNTGVAEDALARAKQLIGWIENKQPEGNPIPATVRGTTRVREDLWLKLEQYRAKPCAAIDLAKAEVQLVWAAHEQPELGKRHATRPIEQVEQHLQQAETCVEKVPPVVEIPPVVAPPVVVEMPSIAPALAGLPDAVHFAFDSATISPETHKVLQRVVDVLRAYPWLKLELGGHTDSKGKQGYNLKLSQRRVKNVHDRLVKQGLSPDRFITRAHGMSQRKMKTNDAAARSRDRRVELIIINPQDATDVKVRSETQESDLQR